jgi:hypothetical protein
MFTLKLIMYPLILEKYHLEMPRELSSTVVSHQTPKYKLVLQKINKPNKREQTLYRLKTWSLHP